MSLYYIRADQGSTAYHLDPQCPLLAQSAGSGENHKGSKYLCIDESQIHDRVLCAACGAPSIVGRINNAKNRVRQPA